MAALLERADAQSAPKSATPIWAWLAPIFALGAIGGALLDDAGQWVYYVCKPLATIFLFAFAWFARHPVSRRYRLAIAIGLVWSLAGDVLLMFPQYFIGGLVCFLIAHLAYIVAFTDGVRLGVRPLIWGAFLVLGAGIVWILWPGLPVGLRVPVLAYAIALATMAAQAITRQQVVGAGQGAQHAAATSARIAAVGAVLFLVSDALLSYGRFRQSLPCSPLLVLGTYYAAQWCIARSVNLRSQGASR